MDRQLLAQLKQTVYKKSVSSTSSYGDITFGTATSFYARVIDIDETVLTGLGSEVRVSHGLVTATSVLISDVLLLPGDSVYLPVRQVTTVVNAVGAVDYYIVKL